MSIAEIAEQSIPFVLNLTAKFRSTQIRTGVLISGPSGWGEFAPFPEYRDEICSKWLAGALESAFGTFPAKLRSSVPVNSIIPILSVEQTISTVEAAVTNYGMTTFKVKVADSTPESLASDELRIKAIFEKKQRIHKQSEVFKPKYIIPFASFVFFCHEENKYMNLSKTFLYFNIACVLDYLEMIVF